MSITTMSLFALISVFLFSHAFATSNTAEQNFIQCLINSPELTTPIAGAIYTPANASFPTVLQAYIRNLRFNESTTPKPYIIITALDLSHVQVSIKCAKKHNLLMKTRSGGHDYEGLSYVAYDHPFFILDLFNFRSINVSIEDETAWVQTGATLGELYYRIAEKSSTHGFPAGVCPTVGVGGHFSGAGYGNMMRKYGLTVDNIIDAEIVDVNGKLLNRESMGEDLFWAITGGGGVSFGVVISYKINLVRVPATVTVFRVTHTSEENVTDVAYRWLRVADKLDENLFIRMGFGVVNNTNGAKTIRASFPSLFLGNTTTLMNIMDQSFPELGLQRSDCQEMNWTQSVLWYYNFPPGSPDSTLLSRIPRSLTHLKRKSDYVKNPISKQGLRFIFQKMIELEHPGLTFNPYGGRMAEISEFAKPFPHRAGNIAKIQYALDWSENGVAAANFYVNLTRVLHKYMTPFVSKSPREAFLNYRDLDIGVNHNGKNSFLEGTVYGVKYFKETNFRRLVKVKTMVDPDNFFRNEQSIPTLPSSRK
ncbi:putative tetrahydroberberine oxidase [Helianthus annuus]|nr:putative tetrahydroberberine oxidase [Helianthus annuus]KAJ0532653.1 putative tetrahydroberberine oxidase [Helianthus annuus]KAJ0710262.1 putative tetrahydroberberine oxidase [Helianthus annuus]